MNKNDLIQQLSDRTGLAKHDAAKAVDGIFDVITDVLKAGDELKLVFPQIGGDPDHFAQLDFGHFFLQPMDGPEVVRNTTQALEYCLRNPRWRLSVQTHKALGIR